MKKLNAIKSEKIWGYENWIASTHKMDFKKISFKCAAVIILFWLKLFKPTRL